MLVPFSPPPGINSDDTTFSAEGQWADGNNVRFRHGKPQPIGGWVRTTIPVVTGICRAITFWSRPDTGVPRAAFGTTTKLQVSTDDATIYDITPSGFTGGATNIWSLDLFGETLVASAAGGKLYQWDGNTANLATEITQAPDNIHGGIVVTDQRQVLALGCNEETSGTVNRMCIRGCDLEDLTDWTSTTTNNAFEHILDGEGMIVAGAKIGPYIAVWTNNALYAGQYIGDPSQTYRFDLVANGCGLVGINAKAIINGVAYWMSWDLTVWTWAPGSPPRAIPCPILKDFRTNCNRTSPSVHRIFAAPVRIFDEIWFFYPRSAATECSHYIAYCIGESSQRPVWYTGTMQRCAWVDDAQVTQFSISSGTNTSSILAVDNENSGATWIQELSNAAGNDARNWHIQSADQYIDESESQLEIQTVIPDFEDQVGDVSLTAFVRDRPQRSSTTKGPYTLATSTTKKDFRASGKLVAIKLSGGAASGSFARLGKLVFKVITKGKRP